MSGTTEQNDVSMEYDGSMDGELVMVDGDEYYMPVGISSSGGMWNEVRKSKRMTRRQRLRKALIKKEVEKLTDEEYDQESEVIAARERGVKMEEEMYEGRMEAERRADGVDPGRRYRRDRGEYRKEYLRDLEGKGMYVVKPEYALHGTKLSAEEKVKKREYDDAVLSAKGELMRLKELYDDDCSRARDGIAVKDEMEKELKYLRGEYLMERKKVWPSEPEELVSARHKSMRRLVPVDGKYLDVPMVGHQNWVPVVAGKVRGGGGGRGRVLHGQSKIERNADEGDYKRKKFTSEFVKQVRDAREKQGLSQKEVGMLVQRHESEYSAFERGELMYDTSLKSMLQWKVLNPLRRMERESKAESES